MFDTGGCGLRFGENPRDSGALPLNRGSPKDGV
jgi:hypothetical protein